MCTWRVHAFIDSSVINTEKFVCTSGHINVIIFAASERRVIYESISVQGYNVSIAVKGIICELPPIDSGAIQ